MLKNAKYGNKSILPELRVITEGLLKGFVIINPRWSGFREQEYLRASASAYPLEEREQQTNKLSFQAVSGFCPPFLRSPAERHSALPHTLRIPCYLFAGSS